MYKEQAVNRAAHTHAHNRIGTFLFDDESE